jgi:hypothetical protein
MANYDAIYPTTSDVSSVAAAYSHAASPVEPTGDNFRLGKVNEVLNHFESEQRRYEKVRKKYARSRSIFHGLSVTAGTLSAILTTGGIATTLTGPGLIVGIPLSAVGGFFGIVSASCGMVTKKLNKKVSKHEKTIQLIISKKDTISDKVSKALNDDKIDEIEFKHIMYELTKYEKLKSDIRIRRSKNNADSARELKKDIPAMRKEIGEAMEELVDRLMSQKK